MKGIIKKIKHGLTIGLATYLIATSVSTASIVAYSNISLKDYSTDAEIESLAEEIGADMSYAMKLDNHYGVMQHNGDEPIYVCFDDNMTEEEKTAATSAIDYIFSVISKINSKYQYQIVNKQTYEDKEYKTRIYIAENDCETVNKLGETEDVRGVTRKKVSSLSKLTNKRTTRDHIIEFNRSCISSMEELIGVIVHEAAHDLGKDDVYTVLKYKKTDKYYGNTIMRGGSASEKMGIFSPNDKRVLVALYSGDEPDKQAINKMLEEYDKFYYDKFSNFCKQRVNTSENVELTNFEIIDNLRITETDGRESGYTYKIIVDDNFYEFYVYDLISGKQLEHTTGKTENVNGTIVLRDVELKKGLRPYDKLESYEGGFVQDLIILSKDQKICWYNLDANDLRQYCEVYDLEKDMGL